MSSREDILQSIRRNTKFRYEKPDLSELESEAVTYSDKIGRFCEVMKQMGGRVIVVGDDDDINEIIRNQYPDVRRIASNMKTVVCLGTEQTLTCATFHPDDVENPRDLNGTDLAIVEGKVGVCENGAVWVCQDVEQRTVYFISEALVLIVDRRNLVNNMHEAYRRIDTGEYGYGVFISGPSKTADIEQALVMGAHGACDVTVLLV